MVLLTATLLGLTAGLMRSVTAIALIATLMIAVFAAAAVFSAGSVHFLAFGLAILGYNLGLSACLVAAAFLPERVLSRI